MGEIREFNLDEVSIRSVCVDVLRHIWVILLAAAAAWFAVTGTEKLIYEPEYTATATLVVNAKGSNSNAFTSLSLTSQMAGVFSEVFDSNTLREKIAQDLGMETVEGEISSSIIEETNLILLKVTSVNPRQTYLMIRSALDNYDSVSDYLFSNAVLRIVQEPTIPYSPSNVPNVARIRRLAMLGTALAVTALLVVLSVLRFTVKTKEGARRNLDGKILGSIPFEKKRLSLSDRMRRKNKSLLISSSMVSMKFAESSRKIATRLSHHMNRRGEKVLMVTSVSENEGKSSVAANLALALAEKGKNVVLIDADLKKPAQYRIFSREKNGQIRLSSYLSGKVSAYDVLEYEKKTNLFHIYQDAGVRNSSVLLDSEKMRTLLKACRKSMDYVILDSSPMALSSDTELMMRQVDILLMIVRQDWTDIRVINDAADVARKSGVDFAGFVLNAFHKDLSLQEGRESSHYYGRRNSQTAEE
ncbi:MAG TPA: polysaccharide biosynthesis tyrosine autokinase [Candidatus Blautia avistercoris]|nr:polysaccharide biosynthesis tyrosine autokinase [Candidatus Blautia avistercoris]